MYNQLSINDQLLLAVEFHLNGLTIPDELVELLGDEVIRDITYVATEGNTREHIIPEDTNPVNE